MSKISGSESDAELSVIVPERDVRSIVKVGQTGTAGQSTNSAPAFSSL